MLGQRICAFLILIDIAKLLSWRLYNFHSRKQLQVSASPMLSGNVKRPVTQKCLAVTFHSFPYLICISLRGMRLSMVSVVESFGPPCVNCMFISFACFSVGLLIFSFWIIRVLHIL